MCAGFGVTNLKGRAHMARQRDRWEENIKMGVQEIALGYGLH